MLHVSDLVVNKVMHGVDKVRQLEQKAYEAEIALEEQHEASQAFMESGPEGQEAIEEMTSQVQALTLQVKPHITPCQACVSCQGV